LEEEYRTTEFGAVNETVQDVHFSRDGKHLVVHTSNSQAPVVIPLGRRNVSGHLIGHQERVNRSVDASSNGLTINPASGPVIHVPTDDTSQVFKPEMAITDTGKAAGTSVVYTGREVTIRKWLNQDTESAQGSREDVLKLTRLPAWNGLASSSVAIRAPQPGEEKLRVVLNKSARDWEDMVHEVDEHLPAIVSRDVRTLVVESSAIESSDARLRRIEGGEMRKGPHI
jgi:hypothetical protein